MPIAAGTRLGPYQVLSPLGSGGMGEVFRARDTRLGRDVAIKVLSQRLTAALENRARLLREAKMISTLKHAHICVLHDIGREGDIDYLVMELVEGETLASRLSRGPLPAQEVLRLGAQIADALASAHRAGVVHRDLKPGNVMLAKGGVKIMDFGLARATRFGPGNTDVTGTALPTESMTEDPITAKGTVVGTFQYMAPEQLEGKPADVRSDIWASGCVLYEMATGKRAFEGSTAVSVISAIMLGHPRLMSELAPLTPPALERLVFQCLAKDPEDRIQSAHDLNLHLKWLTEGVGAERAVEKEKLRHQVRVAWGAAGILALAAIALTTGSLNRRLPELHPARFQVPVPEGLVDIGPPRLSPDGRFLLFNATDSLGGSRLWLRPLHLLTSSPIPGTEGAFRPFWSPDSRFIAFFAGGKLKSVPVSGGPPRTICTDVEGADGTWGSRGTILYDGKQFLQSVSANGGVPAPEARPAAGSADYPWFLPDGRHYLYLAVDPSTPGRTDLRVQSLDSKDKWKRVLSGAYARAEYSMGHLFFVRDGSLMAVPFDPRRLESRGEPVPVTDGVRDVDGGGYFSVSDRGVLAFQGGSRLSQSRFVWMDRSGRELETLGEPGNYAILALSPDDTRVAIFQDWDIWVMDSRGLKTRVTFDPAHEGSPVWAPDGSKILFFSDRGGKFGIYQKNWSGVGEDELLVRSEQGLNPSDISPDGRYIAALGRDGIWILPTFEDRKPRPFLQSPFAPLEPRFSPDGAWIAYSSAESGQREVYVQAFPGPGAKYRVSTLGGRDPQWRGDGREIYFLSKDGDMMAAGVRTSPSFQIDVPHTLFSATIPVNGQVGRNYAVRSDGERFLVRRASKAHSPTTVVLNWKPEQPQ